MDKPNKSFVCHLCGIEITSNLSSMRRHLKNKHQIVEIEGSVKCMESSCDFTCSKIKQLRENLQIMHNIYQDMVVLHFANVQEFTSWKELEEIGTKSCWVKQSGSKLELTYYACNRSGKQRLIAEDNRKRMQKSQGSCKSNITCTSTIVLKNEVDNSVNVTYYKMHYGHDIRMAHTALNKRAKDAIATQLLQRVPITEILNKIRESVDNEFERIHLTTRKDIHNIQACSVIDEAIKHPNDAVSVDMWVTEAANTDDNCVILYKKQGMPSALSSINSQDFLLGLMTKPQSELLRKFGNGGIVCMDATHGTNAYHFNLVSILIVDDFGEGFPVAYLMCNREDYTVLKYFIEAVKEKVGNITAKIFMSDDADQYYAAWSSTMEAPETAKRLCAWHVDRAWRNKIHLIGNSEKQAEVYKTICVLRLEPCEDNFNIYLNSFLLFLETDPTVNKFGNYFKKTYVSRCTMWASCHRLGSSVNTNMHLESMHKVLKYIYLKGITCKRLDKTIHVLLKYIRDKQFQRVIKIEKGKMTSTVTKINKSHITALNSKDMEIMETSDGWVIKSELQQYHIICILTNEAHECNLKCSECSACAHIYSCTCMDYVVHLNMCKHIHRLCMKIKNDNMPKQSTQKNIDTEANTELSMHLTSLKANSNNIGITKNNILKNLSILNATDWCTIVDPQVLQSINKCLTSAVNLISCTSSTSFEVIESRPANKKIDTQLRFHSTRKQNKKKTNRLTKPSLKEVKNIKFALEHMK